MKKIGWLLTFVAVAVFALSAFAEDNKIAYIDLERAINETDEGKAEYSKLKADFDKKQAQLDERAEKLKKMQAEFEKASMVVTGDAKMKKMQELQKELMDAQQLAVALQKELFQKELAVKDKLLGKMVKIIEGIAKREGYKFVLEKKEAGLLYAPPSDDITNEVIRLYNKENPYK
ncbi:MAG: hypothetical protein Kow0090_02240 [Myxococcota bacterium]